MKTTISLNEPKSIAAMIGLGTVGVFSFIVLPGLVQGFVSELGISEADANRLAFRELIGITISTIVLALISRFGQWRTLLMIGLILSAVGNLGSFFAEEVALVGVMRLIAGLGQGVLISLVFTALGLTKNTERNYAIYLVVVLSYGAFGLWSMPILFASIGLDGIFLGWAALALISLLSVRFMPNSTSARSEPGETAARIPVLFLAIALLSFLVYNIAIGIGWANLFLIGMDINPDPQAVANALLLCQFVAIGGALLALITEKMANRNLVIAASIASSSAAIGLLLIDSSFLTYTIVICLFNFLWNFALPFILSAIVDMEETGTVMPFAVTFQMIGTSFGPFFAAQILGDGGSFRAVEFLMIQMFGASLILIILPLLVHSKSLKQKAADL